VTWHVCTHDWPVGDPLDPELVRRVLADFDRYYDGAVRSLAEVPEPAEDGRMRAAGERSER
jgi:hypothetical protein